MKKKSLIIMLFLLAIALCFMCSSCQKTYQDPYITMANEFISRGFPVKILDVTPTTNVAIYTNEVWKCFEYKQEQIYVYFDESNRADYLCDQINKEQFTHVAPFGLRYVLTYNGTDAALLQSFFN